MKNAADNGVPRPPSRTTLEILGPPGAALSIFAIDRTSPAPVRIFEDVLPGKGLLRLRVPRAALRVRVGAREVTVDCATSAAAQRVDFRSEGAGAPP